MQNDIASIQQLLDEST